MYYYERKYGTGRAVLTIVECLVWLVAIVGILIAIGGFGLGRSLGGSVLVGFVCSILGLVITILALIAVCTVQSGKAELDTAEMTRDMLGLQRLHYKQVATATGNHELSSFLTSFGEGQRPQAIEQMFGRPVPEPENDGMLQVPKKVPREREEPRL